MLASICLGLALSCYLTWKYQSRFGWLAVLAAEAYCLLWLNVGWQTTDVVFVVALSGGLGALAWWNRRKRLQLSAVMGLTIASFSLAAAAGTTCDPIAVKNAFWRGYQDGQQCCSQK